MQNEEILIRFNADNVGYKTKEAAKRNIGATKKRLADPKHRGQTTPEELIKLIEGGHSFTPAYMEGTTGDTWKSQQILCLDIDNQDEGKDTAGSKKMIAEPLTPDIALQTLQAWGVTPYFMYYTFSNTENWPRFRIVFILDEALTDPAAKCDYIDRLNYILEYMAPGSTDGSVKDNARSFFGSKEGSCFNITKEITAVADLAKLPKKEQPEEHLKESEEKAPRQAASGADSTDLDALQRQLTRDIEKFDIVNYVIDNYGGKVKKAGNSCFINPCPICGHNDDFSIKPGKGFKCFGAGGGDAGNIINLICAVEGKSKPEAMEKFKFDIMGYDRQEWDAAFKKSIGRGADLKKEAEEKKQEEPQQEEPKQEVKFVNGSEAIDAFFKDVKTESYKPLQTGIKDIDEALGGGFIRKTLIMLGAAPGMGKTALAQWIFENMAAAGNQVLYINLEMSREQLIARSISRQVYKDTQRTYDTNKILQGYRWTSQEEDIIKDAAESYKRKIGGNMIYNPEGTTNHIESIMNVLETAAATARTEGKPTPIICLDYLQMIETGHRDAVEGLKNSVYRLKEYARKNDTIIFVIVANNRNSNITGAAGLESGRDTSALEYAADVHLGLMFTAIYKKWTYTRMISTQQGMKPKACEYDIEALKEFKRAYNDGREPDEIQDKAHPRPWENLTLCINKNRFGVNEKAAHLIFEAQHNIFKQTASEKEAAGFVPTGGRGAFDQTKFKTV